MRIMLVLFVVALTGGVSHVSYLLVGGPNFPGAFNATFHASVGSLFTFLVVMILADLGDSNESD